MAYINDDDLYIAGAQTPSTNTVNPYSGLVNYLGNALRDFFSANQRNYDRGIELDRLQRAGIMPPAGTIPAMWQPTPSELERGGALERDIIESLAQRQARQAAMPQEELIEESTGIPYIPPEPVSVPAPIPAPKRSKPKSTKRTRRNKPSGSGSVPKVTWTAPTPTSESNGIREYVGQASDDYWKGREAELDRVRKSLGLV